MNATSCWNCGVPNPEGTKFCSNCGKPQTRPCPDCGAEVAPGAKFCANCGIRLSAATVAAAPAGPEAPVLTAEARKVVTVLFADLVGSTGLTEKLDPEEAREVVKKFYTVVQGVVEEWYGGRVANYLGDAVLAVFGLPTAHEDDPERAVRAGLAIQQAMPVLNTHLSSMHAVQLAARVGINTGEVVAASGSTFDRDFLVSDAVTTAARLQQNVPPGSVVVGQRTHRLTKEAIDYRQLSPLAVKGRDEPLMVWAASGALPERADIRRVTAPLIGRHGELGIIRHLFQRSRDDGRVHLLTILGQPGVGKSRLMREFLAEVREKDPPPLILRGRSVAFGGQIGYHALLDILRFQGGLLDTDSPETVRGKLQAWVNEVLPERPDVLDGLLLTFGTEETDDDPGRLRRRLFDAWQSLIMGLTASRPVILGFEDLHWADDGVLDLIGMLAERAGNMPLFVVCLARPELLERRPSWGGGRRNAFNLNLEPLRQHEAEELVVSLGRQGLAPEVVRLIAQRAGGNPLFLEELVRMMMEGATPGAQIPDTVQAVLTARIDRLPPDERRALLAASVVGRSFWPSAVSAIAGLSQEETAAALGALIEKDLVVGRPASTIAGEREYAFRHILTRDVAYFLLPKAQRQRAHAQTVRWMESQLGERTEEVVEILAEHLRVAGDPRAMDYLHRAGEKARRQYANDDAIRLFTQALQAASGEAVPPRQAAAIYQDRGDVHQLRGQYDEARSDFEHALALAHQASDKPAEALLENRIGLVYHRRLQLEAAEEHYRRAAALAREAGDALSLGQSLVDIANVQWDRGQIDPEDADFAQGLRLLRQAGDLSSLARGLNLLCMSHLRVGNGEAAIRAAEEARQAAVSAGDKSKEATSLSYLTVVNMYLGRYREGVRRGQAALALAREIEDKRRVAYTLDFLARVQFSLGEWGEAIKKMEDSLPLLKDLARGHLPWGLFYLGVAYDEVGDFSRAARHFHECAGIDPATTSFWQPIVLSRISYYRLTRRVSDLAGEVGKMESMPWDGFVPGGAETLLPVGTALVEFEMRDALRQFVQRRRRGVEILLSPPYLAALAILEAQLAIWDGRVADGIGHLDRALRWSAESENVVTERAALELMNRVRPEPQQRADLQALLRRLAASLPGDLREIFLESPRAGVLKEAGGEGGI